MKNYRAKFLLMGIVAAALFALSAAGAQAQQWTEPVRGSWVRQGQTQTGDVTLTGSANACEIVVSAGEHSAVKRAAAFLAGDIARLSGTTPPIVAQPGGRRVALRLLTLGAAGNEAAFTQLPAAIAQDRLRGQWEAHQIVTTPNTVWLVGANFRGTAFAAYTLSERLGIDPLHHWTGYTPQRRAVLTLKNTNYFAAPPTFKYRGLFHDDEDILPRPFDARNGYPYIRGTVPTKWYGRFFETALRLRMNQVAPFVRVRRPFHIQQMASDWGLFYSSHHYDILLSNPYGYTNFELAKQRGIEGKYDWETNPQGMLRFWRGGVEENKNLDAIYPVGLRGTDDQAHQFSKSVTEEQRLQAYQTAIRDQVRMTKESLPPGKEPIFHFTMYGEMLNAYQRGTLDVPSDVILVWDDNGDGVMRALPQNRGAWKHGVYYHLAFFGATAKQSVHTVTPMRVEQEFRKIVNAGATEYMLVNVSELREHVMETRFIADICWDAPTAFAQPDAASRYINWWCREYFGTAAAPTAAQVYRRYYAIHDEQHKIWYASVKVRDALMSLMKKFNNESFEPARADTKATLRARSIQFAEAMRLIDAASARMNPQQRQFFFEHAALGLLIDYRPTQAALLLIQAMETPDKRQAWQLVASAMAPLQQMEREIARAERAPFAGWYRPTWIRVGDFFNGWSDMNPHRPYEMLRRFLQENGPPPAVLESAPRAGARTAQRP